MTGLIQLAMCWALAAPPSPPINDKVDFNREVRPILSDKCYRCPGPDEGERKAKLRLDTRQGALAARERGAAVVPGKSGSSRLLERVTAADPSDRMPPPETGKHLNEREVETLRRWIDQGAGWSEHWAFVPPRRPEPPPEGTVPAGIEAARNPIDLLVRARLAKAGLAPSPPADPVTLLRRVTLDLTGLPPTPAEIDAFLADPSPAAYEAAVDRLFQSPHHGEHFARYWLDVVRYGDTHGLHFDNERAIWPYRDWVIRSFAENKPFDAFTVEQLAGDLLPDPTTDQRVATGFVRCNVTTSEGGSIDEEVLVRYGVDRVEALGTVWLGLTVGCAVCHDHKFDPISQKEFYQLFAFFNSLEESAMDGNAELPPPFVKVARPEDAREIAQLQEEARALRTRLDAPLPEVDAAQDEWERGLAERLQRTWRPAPIVRSSATGGATLRSLEDGSVLAEGESPDASDYELVAEPGPGRITAIRLEALRHGSLPNGGAGRADNSNFVLSEIEAALVLPAPAGGAQEPAVSLAIASAEADHSQKGYEIPLAIDGKSGTGWAVDGPSRREDRTAVFRLAEPVDLPPGAQLRVKLSQRQGGRHTIGRPRLSISGSEDLAAVSAGPWSQLGPLATETPEKAFALDHGPEAELDLARVFEGGKVRWAEKPELADGAAHELPPVVGATYLTRQITSGTARRVGISLGSDDGFKLWLNGKLIAERNVSRAVSPDQESLDLDLAPGANRLLLKVANLGGNSGFYFRLRQDSAAAEILELSPLLARPRAERSAEDLARLRTRFRQLHSPAWKELEGKTIAAETRAREREASLPGTLVTKELAMRREAHVLVRGQYTQKGARVEPEVPAVFPPLGPEAPRNRLGLARWLVSPEHPLTARVAVNRFWQQYFGTGIVKTAVDFGSQGEWPVNPELLDWLAVELRESGWDVRRIQKLIVLSATYRQASRVSAQALEKDPENRLLSRGPRFRMDGEMIRDLALAASGLLVPTVGGPSVKPYQPPGIWEAVGFIGSNTSIYKQDKGHALHRRGLYTFWKRTAPPPVLSLFDAPTRETCTALRPRTNTPLQALALMNDVQFFEAARALAERALKEGPATPEGRLSLAFRLATARTPRADELEVLLDSYRSQLAGFAEDPEAARQTIAVGETAADPAIPPGELAAMTLVANLILNLDETLTKG